MEGLFGSNSSNLRKQQEAQQRQQLAQLARQQGELDQQAAQSGGVGRRSGRGLLTFLSGTGQDTLG